jgi:hypothetical protein
MRNSRNQHDETEVLATLAALRDSQRTQQPPPRVEAAVLAAWDADHTRAAVARWRSWRLAAPVAAAVLMASSLTMLGHRLQFSTIEPSTTGATTMLLVGEPIGDREAVRVVRMRLPAATLHALGIASSAGALADGVDVDVIVGEDGVARAIRVGM